MKACFGNRGKIIIPLSILGYRFSLGMKSAKEWGILWRSNVSRQAQMRGAAGFRGKALGYHG
jgi:hypothetical protein